MGASWRRRLSAAAALAAATALGLAVGGCGSSSSSGTSADPAGVVPAETPLYVGADVRPEGGEKSGALAAGRSLTHQANPYPRLLQVLQTPGSPPLQFSRDVAPWLGPHAGLFLSSLSSAGALVPLLEQGLLGSATGASFPFRAHGAQGAIVMDTSDASKARSFIDAQAAHAGAQTTSYRGVSYELTTAGMAFGIVERFAVIGSETGMHAVIDTALGGAELTHAAGYSKLLAEAPAGTLAHVFTDPTGEHEGGPQQTGSGLLTLLSGSRQANISLVPAATSLAVYVDAIASASTGTPGGLLASAAEGTRAFDELPGDSWLAVGLGHLGTTLGEDVSGLGELARLASSLGGSGQAGSSAGALSIGGLLEGLLAPLAALGADTARAKADYTSWMGSGGIYASGSGLLELKGAVVIESKNPSASRAAVAKLAAQLQSAGNTVAPATIAGTDAAVSVRVKGLPLAIYIANGTSSDGQTKFVIGLGEASVTEALSPSSTLAGAPSHSAAASALGEGLQPSLLFEVPTLLSLLEGIGLTEDPTLSKVVPYLRALSTVAGGGHALGGEVERYKLVVGLEQSSG